MSVHERLFLRTDLSPFELSSEAAGLVGGQAEDRGDHAYLLVDTARLVPGMTGEFGGPVRGHESDLPFRPEGSSRRSTATTGRFGCGRLSGPAGRWKPPLLT